MQDFESWFLTFRSNVCQQTVNSPKSNNYNFSNCLNFGEEKIAKTGIC